MYTQPLAETQKRVKPMRPQLWQYKYTDKTPESVVHTDTLNTIQSEVRDEFNQIEAGALVEIARRQALAMESDVSLAERTGLSRQALALLRCGKAGIILNRHLQRAYVHTASAGAASTSTFRVNSMRKATSRPSSRPKLLAHVRD